MGEFPPSPKLLPFSPLALHRAIRPDIPPQPPYPSLLAARRAPGMSRRRFGGVRRALCPPPTGVDHLPGGEWGGAMGKGALRPRAAARSGGLRHPSLQRISVLVVRSQPHARFGVVIYSQAAPKGGQWAITKQLDNFCHPG